MEGALRRLLWPESVAIVGASPTREWARHMLSSLRQMGFKGDVFPINPQYKDVDGLPCYPSVRATPRVPDAAIIVVRRELAVTTIEECADCGVGGTVVLSGGFAEAGPEGRALQDRLRAAARRSGMVVLGPNCQGYINCLQPSALWMDEIFEPLRPGSVAIISHSGTISTGIMNHLYRRGVYTSYTVSIGNEADITAADLIEAFVTDESTRIIATYLETLRDPDRFFAACDRAAAANKPVLVMKVGRSPAAREAIQAHTGALAGPDRMIDALFARHRVIRVRSMEEAVETCVALSGRRLMSPRLSVFASSGGHIELAADAAASTALMFPAFESETSAKLIEALPEFRPRVAKNPFDYGGAPLPHAIDAISRDPAIDAVVFITQTRRHPTGVPHLLQRVVDMAKRVYETSSKPVIVLSANGDVEKSTAVHLAEHGIPLIAGIDTGLQALNNAYRYHAPRLSEAPVRGIDSAGLLRRVRGLRRPLTGMDALDFVRELGLPTVKSIEVATAGEAVRAARDLGYPVVLKSGAPELLHKTETGQVFVNLTSENAVERAAGAVKPPILVQAHIVGTAELIVGLQSEPHLGTCVMVGMGGVLAELLDITSLRPVPLQLQEAAEMLAELPSNRILDGYRGAKPADRGALIAAIERVAAIGEAAGSAIRSMDLNPVIVTPDGVYVVDAVVLPDTSNVELADGMR